MSLLVGIPILCRYDLLDKLIESGEAGSLPPKRYLVIDNGGSYRPKNQKVQVLRQTENIGVSRSWNLLLESAGHSFDDLEDDSDPTRKLVRLAGEPILICNDDITFGKKTVERLAFFAPQQPFLTVRTPEADLGWSIFVQSPEVTARVGWYDENFWPGYYEDCDYLTRMEQAGVDEFGAYDACEWNADKDFARHLGWATTRAKGNETWLREGREACRLYFHKKWGGPPYHQRWGGMGRNILHKSPFDTHYPENFSLRPQPPRNTPP